MNYEFDAEAKRFFDALSQMVHDFSLEREPERALGPALEANLRDLLERLARTPYLALGLDGGAAGAALRAMRAGEVFATHTPSLFLAVETGTRRVAKLLEAFGTEGQRSAWLPRLLEGKRVGAVALSEGAMNMENDEFETEGRREKGRIVVHGIKHFVVNGPVADLFAVAGRLDGRAAVFLLERDTPGLVAGERVETLGCDGMTCSMLELNGCVVEPDGVIGPMERQRLLDTLLRWEDLALVAASLGLMHAALETARTFANLHMTGGKPLVAYQEVAFKLAEMLAGYQAAQLLAYRAAWTVDVSPRQAGVLVSCAKVFCGETAEQVASSALQVLSGDGYVSGNPAERAYRAARYIQIAGRSSELSRMKIAGDVLGRRR